jgi:hypothetical protein
MDLQQKAILVALAALAVIGGIVGNDTLQNHLQTKQREAETTEFLKGTRSNEIRCVIHGNRDGDGDGDGDKNGIPVLFSAHLVMGWATLGFPGNTEKITMARVGGMEIGTQPQQLEPFKPFGGLKPGQTQYQAIVSSYSDPSSDPSSDQSSYVLGILTQNALRSMRGGVPGVDLKLGTTDKTVEATNGTFECITEGYIQEHIDTYTALDRERLKKDFKDLTESSKGSPFTKGILFNYAGRPFIIAKRDDGSFLFLLVDPNAYDRRLLVRGADPNNYDDPYYFTVPHYPDGEEALVNFLNGKIPGDGDFSKYINGVEVLIKSPENTPENTVDLSNSLRGRDR